MPGKPRLLVNRLDRYEAHIALVRRRGDRFGVVAIVLAARTLAERGEATAVATLPGGQGGYGSRLLSRDEVARLLKDEAWCRTAEGNCCGMFGLDPWEAVVPYQGRRGTCEGRIACCRPRKR